MPTSADASRGNRTPIAAVLMDVGGPVLEEDADFRACDEALVALLRDEGVSVDAASFARARMQAIERYSPSYNSATIWTFVAPDFERFLRVRRALTRWLRQMRRTPTVRDGALDVVRELAERYRLVLAGNQPREVRSALEEAGLLRHCTASLLSDDLGVFKPDTRFFLAALRAADATAQDSVMVGDRLDNDVYPANILGMRTVRIETGPFAAQTARTPRDLPDATIRDIRELPDAVRRLET